MEILEQVANGTMIFSIVGRLDTTNYLQLEKKLMEAIDGGNDRIVIDCNKMDYVSSSGLRVFLMALKKVNLTKGRFILTGLQETIREIFEIAGFNSIFEILKTNKEAEEALK
jgi:anti-anti-sigma factor